MTAKEYLGQLRRLDVVINNKIKELDELRSVSGCVSGIDYASDKVQVSPKAGGSFEEVIEKIILLDEYIDELTDKFIKLKIALNADIEELTNLKYKKVLQMRYIELLPFDEIAGKMGISERSVYYIHGRALASFEKKNEQKLNSCCIAVEYEI